MATNTIMTTGTKIFVKPTANAAYLQVKGFLGFSGLGGGSAAIIDATDLDSTRKEKRMGLADEGQLSLDFNYLPNDAGQKALSALRASGEIAPLKIAMKANAAVFEMDTYILSAEKSGSIDALALLKVSAEITGEVTETTTP